MSSVVPTAQELLGAALSYAAHGWRVIPLWWPAVTGATPACACPQGAHCGRDGRNTGKHPLIDDWPDAATTDVATIRAWWTQSPRANIGLVTGDGLVNLDIDPRNGGHLSLQDLQATYGTLPETPIVQTGGGGEHRLFTTTADLPTIKLAPGIDFLADRTHQFVAVPSLHKSGKAYVWEVSSHPDDLPLAPLPAWVVALVQSSAAEQVAAATALPETLPAVDVSALTLSARMKGVIQTGDDPKKPYVSRSEALFAVLTEMVRKGYDDATMAAVVLDPANGISDKPLGQKNQRSPQYWTLTRGWMAREIARVRAKAAPTRQRTVPMMGQATPTDNPDADRGNAPSVDPDAARQSAADLLSLLNTTEDPIAKEDAVLDAMPVLAALDEISWVRLKRKLKAAVPSLNLNDLTRIRNTFQKDAKQAARESAGDAQAQGDAPSPEPDTDQEPTNDSTNKPAVPEIILGPDIKRVVDETIAAIRALPGEPQLYQRSGMLHVISQAAPTPTWLQRPSDLPTILAATAPHLRELAATAATWLKVSRNKKGEQVAKPALPPDWAISALIARPGWPFVPLEGIVCSPTLRADGTVLATPGYDRETGLSLHFTGEFPKIPAQPTEEDARQAVAALLEPFKEFPFVARYHESAALAALCSVVARPAIAGNVPLFAVRSTTRGAGKGLLIDAISMLALGRHAPRMAQTPDEEEERKRLLSLALAGTPMLHIDNVTGPLGSGSLDMALTAPTFGDRLLGTNATKEAPMNVVFFASGNNMAFRGDLARRVVPIDLDPQMERPEERGGFTHSPLLDWIQKHRKDLLIAALTLLRAYCVAKKPPQSLTPLGSFEEWSNLIRQALVWVGMEDPCAGRKDIEAESDPEHARHADLLDAWESCYPEAKDAATVSQAIADIAQRQAVHPTPPNEWNHLLSVLGGFDKRFDGKRLDSRVLGEVFRKHHGDPIDGKRLVKAGTYNRAVKWKVEKIAIDAVMSRMSHYESFRPRNPEKRKGEGERERKVIKT